MTIILSRALLFTYPWS